TIDSRGERTAGSRGAGRRLSLMTARKKDVENFSRTLLPGIPAEYRGCRRENPLALRSVEQQRLDRTFNQHRIRARNVQRGVSADFPRGWCIEQQRRHSCRESFERCETEALVLRQEHERRGTGIERPKFLVRHVRAKTDLRPDRFRPDGLLEIE